MHDEPEKYRWIFNLYNHTVGRNKIRGKKGNGLDICCAKMDRTQIYFAGTGNEVIVEQGAQIQNCVFRIMGNHNRIFVGRDATLICVELWISKDKNQISLGAGTAVIGKPEYPTHLAAIEGTEISVGKDCMISASVEIRTADGHSIVDLEGKRVNPSQSVHIGDHVWMGTGVVCTKGVEITDHCIVGTRSVVTKSITERYCAVGGNPARVLREGLDWRRELMEVTND